MGQADRRKAGKLANSVGSGDRSLCRGQSTMKRKVLVAASALALSVCIFVYGILVGAKQYPPYHAMLAVKDMVFGSGRQPKDSIVDPRYRETDPERLIQLESARDVDAKRKRLVGVLWSSRTLPLDTLPRIDKDVSDERYHDLVNVRRIDRLTVEMDFGLRSVCYHFLPKGSNGHLVIYHQGHRGDFFLGKHLISNLLSNGYSVVGMAMPLRGLNNRPVVRLDRVGRLKIESHDQMKFLTTDSGHPLRFFIEPVVAVVNYAKTLKVDTVNMIGISGGGWTTVLSAAVDARINRSYSVAGSLPIYLRSEEPKHWGDYEQTAPEIYTVANYLELYILASTGNQGGVRRHFQILNRYDSCCFFGLGFKTYEDHVVDAVRSFGQGQFDVLLDETHREHKISEWAWERILANLKRPVESDK
jgi:hypothetical protein